MEIQNALRDGIKTLGNGMFCDRDASCEKIFDTNYIRLSNINYLFEERYPFVFDFLQKLFGISRADYVNSLCDDEHPLLTTKSSGKSGSFFMLSADSKFLLKTISNKEAKTLLHILPSYFDYISNHSSSLLPRFFGCYKIKISGKSCYLVSMNNLFCSFDSSDPRYDLKGSMVLRKVSEKERTANPSCTLKDANWVEDDMKIFIGREQRETFLNQLRKDSAFLNSFGIMDYSLLIGVHRKKNRSKSRRNKTNDEKRMRSEKERKKRKKRKKSEEICSEEHNSPFVLYGKDFEYTVGIIDILCVFSANKKIPYAYKTLKYGTHADFSTVPPRKFAKRFVAFIAKHTE